MWTNWRPHHPFSPIFQTLNYVFCWAWVPIKPGMASNFLNTHQRKTFQLPSPSKKMEPRKELSRWWYPWRFRALWLELETLWLSSEVKAYPARRYMSVSQGSVRPSSKTSCSLSWVFKLKTKTLGLGVHNGSVAPRISKSLRRLMILPLRSRVKVSHLMLCSSGPWNKCIVLWC